MEKETVTIQYKCKEELERKTQDFNALLEKREQYSRLSNLRIFCVPYSTHKNIEGAVIKICRDKLQSGGCR